MCEMRAQGDYRTDGRHYLSTMTEKRNCMTGGMQIKGSRSRRVLLMARIERAVNELVGSTLLFVGPLSGPDQR